MKQHLPLLLVAAAMIFLATCVTAAPGRPFTPRQVNALAAVIVRNTPDHIHFAPGTRFAWVLADWDPDGSPPEVWEAVLRRLEKKYQVYRSENEIPEEALVKKDGEIIGYQGGFAFGFEIERAGPGIQVQYHDYEGNLGASGHSVRYKWTGLIWVPFWRSRLIVA